MKNNSLIKKTSLIILTLILLFSTLPSQVASADSTYWFYKDTVKTVKWPAHRTNYFDHAGGVYYNQVYKYKLVYDYGCKKNCYLYYAPSSTKNNYMTYDFSIFDHFTTGKHLHQAMTFPSIKVKVYVILKRKNLLTNKIEYRKKYYTTFYLQSGVYFNGKSFN